MKISVFMEHIFQAAEQEKTDICSIMKKVGSYGISGVELNYGRISADNTLPSVIRSCGLDIACVYAFFDFSHNKDMSYPVQVINNLSNNKINRLMAIPGFIEKNDNPERAVADMYECMNKLTELADKNNISVTMEDFDDKKAPFSTAEGLLGFMKNVNGLTCAFDMGNFIYSGESETEAFGLLKEYVTHVHCKDRCLTEKAGETPKISLKNLPLYSSPTGYGVIKIKEIVSRLKNAGYNGWYAIEHFDSMTQLSDMKKSAEKLKEWLG